ncbi:MAG TPA: CHRD domain-containing protein [Thermoanaerobaculia bacterium]|nr:CHRD domain-containing protein [Thermoanaerobaculia bacterium]
MKRTVLAAAILAAAGLVIRSGSLAAQDSQENFQTGLTGFQEVPPILTGGKGVLNLELSSSSIAYSLTFSGLSSDALASHIHFGERGVNGAVIVFLCGGGGKPACPAGGGTVTGTITGADVLGVAAQGVTAGSFADLVRILMSGDGYANVHTTNHPGGEIRGQISANTSGN